MSKRISFSLVLFFALLIAGGTYFYFNAVPISDVTQGHPQQRLSKLELQKHFDVIITTFKNRVRDEMASYKEQRQLLAKMVLPVTLNSTQEIEENYQLTLDITASIRQQSAKVLDSFIQADKDVSELISRMSAQEAMDVQEKWERLKAETSSEYQRFFEMDDKVLVAYEDFMAFLYSKRHTIKIDAIANEFIFSSAQDRAEFSQKKQNIRKLLVEQATSLKQND